MGGVDRLDMAIFCPRKANGFSHYLSKWIMRTKHKDKEESPSCILSIPIYRDHEHFLSEGDDRRWSERLETRGYMRLEAFRMDS